MNQDTTDEIDWWRCEDCQHTEAAGIDEYAGDSETRVFGSGRREVEREILICPECGSNNWHPDSVATALLGRDGEHI